MAMDKQKLKDSLQLEPHPSGGFFRQTLKSNMDIEIVNDQRYDGYRKACTCIYYMLEENGKVSWHRHKGEDIFFWHTGGIAKFHFISEKGEYTSRLLGNHLVEPQANFHIAVTPGDWYAIENYDKKQFVLWSATVSPGFEFKDWEEGNCEQLLSTFPQHQHIFKQFA